MHLPLIDIPKPKHSARPRCASAWVLFALWLAAFFPWLQRSPQPQAIVIGCPPTAESSPVKYMKVTTADDITGWQGCEGRCVILHTHQMPLMELYDELCEIEDREPLESTLPPSDKVIEQRFLRAEKQFAAKYGLTIKQVGEIKREGSRLKQGMGE